MVNKREQAAATCSTEGNCVCFHQTTTRVSFTTTTKCGWKN